MSVSPRGFHLGVNPLPSIAAATLDAGRTIPPSNNDHMGALRSVERLAARQFGVFRTTQAIEVGVTPRMMARRRASGEWQRMLPRVHRVVAVAGSFRQRAMAAALWGERTVWYRTRLRPRSAGRKE